MARSRAFSRYLFRLRHQKRYSFTKTKMLVGFIFSLFTSIYIGTYLENYGFPILQQTYVAITDVFDEKESGATQNQNGDDHK